MHRGCFVSTLTPPLLDRRTHCPGPVRVCIYVLLLARLGELAPRHVPLRLILSSGRWRCSPCSLGHLRAAVA